MKPFIIWGIIALFFTSFSTNDPIRAVDLTLKHGNTLYIGAKNIVRIRVAGIPSSKLTVEGVYCTIKRLKKNDEFEILPQKPNVQARINISHKRKKLRGFVFETKYLPEPIPVVGKSKEGKVRYTAKEFKQINRIDMAFSDFEVRARNCKMLSCRVTRIGAAGEKDFEINRTNQFNSTVQALVNQATAGDMYIFDYIKSQCSGDLDRRKITPALVFYIR